MYSIEHGAGGDERATLSRSFIKNSPSSGDMSLMQSTRSLTSQYPNPPNASPIVASSNSEWNLSASVSAGATDGARRNSHRTSVVPGATPSTDEYAKIIMQARNAKLRKWVPSPGQHTRRKRAGIPVFPLTGSGAGGEEEDDGSSSSELEVLEDGLGEEEQPKEIEWVDWLEEYKKMKDAKLRSEESDVATINEDRSHTDGDVGDTGPSHLRSGPRSEADFQHHARKASDDVTDVITLPDVSVEGDSPLATHHVNMSMAQIHTPSVPEGAHSPRRRSISVVDSAAQHQSRMPPQRPPPPPPSVTSQTESSSHTGAPRKRRNLNLGAKIDAWWAAVRSSFNPLKEKEPSPIYEHVQREHLNRFPSHQEAAAPQPIRKSSSVVELQHPAPVYRGALAPAARITTQFPSPHIASVPMQPSGPFIGSTQGEVDETQSRSESKRRNPNLSLKLDGSQASQFASGHANDDQKVSVVSPESSISGGASGKNFFALTEKPNRHSSIQHAVSSQEPTPGLTLATPQCGIEHQPFFPLLSLTFLLVLRCLQGQGLARARAMLSPLLSQ
ncbi:hypothetical protein BT69DRAFT_1014424 [Atractiella rhizophila]|nr:hypothetical protein BT69DRAFT_1014424 [Atractiella rhizophila]